MYKLVWKNETIEDEIKTLQEAEYLRNEYALAYGGVVTIKRCA